jgi:hypothetical protein
MRTANEHRSVRAKEHGPRSFGLRYSYHLQIAEMLSRPSSSERVVLRSRRVMSSVQPQASICKTRMYEWSDWTNRITKTKRDTSSLGLWTWKRQEMRAWFPQKTTPNMVRPNQWKRETYECESVSVILSWKLARYKCTDYGQESKIWTWSCLGLRTRSRRNINVVLPPLTNPNIEKYVHDPALVYG